MRYRMPAEWEPHAATWLAWPHSRSAWPGKFEPVPYLYAEIVRILSRHEGVCILCPQKHQPRAEALLERAGALNERVALIASDTNRSWTRNYCPLWVKGPRGRKAVKFQFNGWAKYGNWKKDNEAGWQVAGESRVEPEWNGRPMVLEGGSIDVNGKGLLLTTEECVPGKGQQRNPGMTRAQYEAMFEGWLGARQVIWLGEGIAGDVTHGHIDNLARFTDERTILIAVETDRTDPNYAPLRENLRRLRKVQGIRVFELPMPRPVVYNNRRLPASYANFYIANKQVLVPQFSDPSDSIALNIIKGSFPTRDVIGIYCRDLVLGLGGLHSMTMQQPA